MEIGAPSGDYISENSSDSSEDEIGNSRYENYVLKILHVLKDFRGLMF